MKLLSALVALTFVMGFSAHAQQKQPVVRKRPPMKAAAGHSANGGAETYGMAGCGLGSIVFADKPGFIQIFAVTINATGVQTFGISTGTSNCGEVSKQAQATQFIEVNKVAIETDLSRGQGETLAALSEVLDCKNSGFESDMKNTYNKSFPHGGASTAQLEATAYQACE